MAFVGSIGVGFINLFKMGPPQYELRHQEVVEMYKHQLMMLEIELSRAKEEKDKYEHLLFEHLGIMQPKSESSIEHRPITRPMSLSRIKNSLSRASVIANESATAKK